MTAQPSDRPESAGSADPTDVLRLEDTPLSHYLGSQLAQQLARQLGLETLGQLLDYYPRKYLPRGRLVSFTDLQEGEEVSILARVERVRTRKLASRRGSITEVQVSDLLTEGQTGSAQPSQPAAQGSRASFLAARLEGGAWGVGPSGSSNYPSAGYSQGYSSPSAYGSYPPAAYQQGSWSANYPAFAFPPRLSLSFFNAWTAARDLEEGDQLAFTGKVSFYRGQPTLTNPHYLKLGHLETPEGGPSAQSRFLELARARVSAPIPVYKASPKFPSDRLEALIQTVLSQVNLKDLEDPLPADIRARRKIPSLEWTYRAIHSPEREESWRQALQALRYREAFILQSALARIRQARAAQQTQPRPYRPGGLADALLDLLPFDLTEGQKRVSQEISQDLASSRPMNRLLQGDVGSGKTVLALQAMLQVADHGAQAALLAPTEVLAEQHYRSICQILGELLADEPAGQGSRQLAAVSESRKVRVLLLTASMKSRAKKEALLALASGEADLVIGTHALLSDTVSFADLGLVIVDEQHRFGVEQRDALRGPGGSLPHRLVMTATPIPRTVAMTVFGDLDTSTLDQLPAGRQEVSTHLVPLADHPRWEQRIWARAREEIDAGHQVYVVVPKIGSSEAPEDREAGQTLFDLKGPDPADPGQPVEAAPLASVEETLEELKGQPALAGVRIEALHGRMDSEAKNRVMTGFAAGSIDLLVATTVIEVGVNVPNATLMVILDADRFGISGLHQLRGRIGRGSLPGTCLLVTRQQADGVSRERLKAVAATRDGFELSRVDLEQRREGDILGAAQSGKKSTLRLLRVLTDAKLIEKARQDAFSLSESDPTLSQHPSLARSLDRALDADREAFLGRA